MTNKKIARKISRTLRSLGVEFITSQNCGAVLARMYRFEEFSADRVLSAIASAHGTGNRHIADALKQMGADVQSELWVHPTYNDSITISRVVFK